MLFEYWSLSCVKSRLLTFLTGPSKDLQPFLNLFCGGIWFWNNYLFCLSVTGQAIFAAAEDLVPKSQQVAVTFLAEPGLWRLFAIRSTNSPTPKIKTLLIARHCSSMSIKFHAVSRSSWRKPAVLGVPDNVIEEHIYILNAIKYIHMRDPHFYPFKSFLTISRADIFIFSYCINSIGFANK